MSARPQRSPQSEPERAPFARALWTWVSGRAATAADDIDALRGGALLEKAGEARWSALEERSRALGYVLACLHAAGGRGHERVRHEARGLEHLLRACDEILRAHGRAPRIELSELPSLRAGVGRGWELAYALACAVHGAALGAEPERSWAWRLERADALWELTLPAEFGAAHADELRAVCDRLRGLELRGSADALRLCFPCAWVGGDERPGRGARA